jgi:hypothetical protein
MGIFLLLATMLFQEPPPAGSLKPILDNERAIVWDVKGPVAATKQSMDTVVVELSGKAKFVPKGAMLTITEHSIVIDIKDHAPNAMKNTTGFPLAFPRPGSKKILENARVIVWDYTWKTGIPTPMHFHNKDVVVTYLEDGDLKSTTPDAKITVNQYKFGDVRFNLRDRVHTETLVEGKQHAIITEFK